MVEIRVGSYESGIQRIGCCCNPKIIFAHNNRRSIQFSCWMNAVTNIDFCVCLT